MAVSALAVSGLLFALLDRLPDGRVLQVEVVVEFVRVHERGHRDPVLLEDKVFTLLVQAAHQCAEVAAGLGNGEVVNQGCCGVPKDDSC